VHDGLAQIVAAAYQRLQAFAQRHAPASESGREDLDRVLRLVRQTVGEARRVIGNLRPTALDDLGLAAAICQEVEGLRGDGWEVAYEEKLGEERLPVVLETTLLRVAQEALTNARKHAQTDRASVELRRGEDTITQSGGSRAQVRSCRHGRWERTGREGRALRRIPPSPTVPVTVCSFIVRAPLLSETRAPL
jgi:signal transduction histidine kinase